MDGASTFGWHLQQAALNRAHCTRRASTPANALNSSSECAGKDWNRTSRCAECNVMATVRVSHATRSAQVYNGLVRQLVAEGDMDGANQVLISLMM